jgi:hypothetical protein
VRWYLPADVAPSLFNPSPLPPVSSRRPASSSRHPVIPSSRHPEITRSRYHDHPRRAKGGSGASGLSLLHLPPYIPLDENRQIPLHPRARVGLPGIGKKVAYRSLDDDMPRSSEIGRVSSCTSCLSTASCSTPGLATIGSIICASYAQPSESGAQLRAPAGYRAAQRRPATPGFARRSPRSRVR